MDSQLQANVQRHTHTHSVLLTWWMMCVLNSKHTADSGCYLAAVIQWTTFVLDVDRFPLLLLQTVFLLWPRCSQSVRLHAQLSRITAIVQLCYSIRQLLLSENTLVVIDPPPADLFTSPAASAFVKDGVRRAKQSYIFVHSIYGVHDNYTN